MTPARRQKRYKEDNNQPLKIEHMMTRQSQQWMLWEMQRDKTNKGNKSVAMRHDTNKKCEETNCSELCHRKIHETTKRQM